MVQVCVVEVMSGFVVDFYGEIQYMQCVFLVRFDFRNLYRFQYFSCVRVVDDGDSFL